MNVSPGAVLNEYADKCGYANERDSVGCCDPTGDDGLASDSGLANSNGLANNDGRADSNGRANGNGLAGIGDFAGWQAGLPESFP